MKTNETAATVNPYDGVHGDIASGPSYFAPEHERDVLVVDAKGKFFILKADDQLDAEKLAAIWKSDGALIVEIRNPNAVDLTGAIWPQCEDLVFGEQLAVQRAAEQAASATLARIRAAKRAAKGGQS